MTDMSASPKELTALIIIFLLTEHTAVVHSCRILCFTSTSYVVLSLNEQHAWPTGWL